MTKSVIKDIFNGVKGNRETMPLAKANKDNLKEVSEYYEKIKNQFNEKRLNLIEKLLDVYDKNHYGEVDFYFTEGVKLGLHIGIECFKEN